MDKGMFSRHTALPAVGSTRLPIQWKPGAPSPQVKQPERATGHSPTLVPILRMSGAVPLLPLYAFMACTGTALPLNRLFFPEVTFPVLTAVFLNDGRLLGFYAA